MKNLNTLTAIAAGCLLLTACGNNGGGKSGNADSAAAPKPLAPIALTPVMGSPEFPGAELMIKSVKAEKVGTDSAKVSFAFDLKNYELKSQTSDKDTKLCNNSDKGQHIHFIMDNLPYKALYEPNGEITLANGTEHYLMAFLSRSYHESIKSKGAAVVYHFKIDEKGNLKKMEDPKTPMIFYSRPKGDYIGKDTTNVLLDYYVWNCELAPDGYKVKAVVLRPMSDPFVATLSKWEPNFIQNLSGNCKVSLQLIDKDGKNVEGPQTNVSRDVKMLVADPMKK